MSRYAIGIDLGTTNCALAYVEIEGRKSDRPRPAKTFEIPQLIEPGELSRRPLLPSMTYLPGEHDLPPGSTALPWDPEAKRLVGEAAQRQGARVPGRLVTSAKSWLCHGGVDRQADILPFGADEAIEKISPVDASAAYLRHLRDAWNSTIAKDRPEDQLERQHLVLTVPASFDEVARELTVAAAHEAGLKKFTLLEEPQAAFYRWLFEATAGAGDLAVGSSCLVIDVGGGTTDFSLIAAVEKRGEVEYQRVAVGEHLLLGGDNMDMALARHIEQSALSGHRLDSTQWGNLVLSCRQVKERMLAENPPATLPVTILGRGRKLIGSTIRADLDRDTVHRLTVDAFFPTTDFDAAPARSGRAGFQEFGLPFVADPAITRHLAAFLKQHAESLRRDSATDHPAPSAILFNGGVFNAKACCDQVRAVMGSWYGADWKPEILDSPSFDLAVACGAAYFGWSKAVGGRRIKSSAARSYYVGIEAAAKDAAGPSTVLCLVPCGLEEGKAVVIDRPGLELQIGQPVAFPIFTSTVRMHDQAGELLQVDADQLGKLPALTTILRGGRRAGQKQIPVLLEAQLTEIGTLELYCVAREGDNRWKLHFQTRSVEAPERSTPAASAAATETWSQEQFAGAEEVLKRVFAASGRAEPSEVAQVTRRLEESLSISRKDWPMPVLRGLWELLSILADARKTTPEREARWYNLVGYCLRPGWGDPIDQFRVERLWKAIHQGPVAVKNDLVWTEYWIMCRRIAGGLDANRQQQLVQRMTPYLFGGRKPSRRAGNQEVVEIWRAFGASERVDPKLKVEAGETLVAQIRKRSANPAAFWALTRLGARVPLYAPINLVVDLGHASKWLQVLLDVDASDPRSIHERDFAIAQLARRSGDRARDIDDELRARVTNHLRRSKPSSRLISMVEEVSHLEEAEETELLGDAVPKGLRLAV